MNPAACLVVLALAGCDHTEPFGPEPSHLGLHPLHPGRMTLSVQPDALQGHSYSGDEVFYTFCDDLKAERNPPCGAIFENEPTDQCLGALPAEGGARTVSLCPGAGGDADSIQVYHSGTRLADGSIVFVYSSRRWFSSLTSNAALYRWQPGDRTATRLIEYPTASKNEAVPFRVIAAGSGRVFTASLREARLVEIGADGSVQSFAAPRFSSIDPRAGVGLLVRDNQLVLYDLDTKIESLFLAVPSIDNWLEPEIIAAGLAGNTVVISQSGLTGDGSSLTARTRLVLLRRNAAPIVLSTHVIANEIAWGTVSVAPDEQSVVGQFGGDLYRIALP